MSRSAIGSRRRRAAPSRIQTTTAERVAVEKLAAGGSGFGRLETGEPIFVRGALPGDAVSVRQLRRRNGYSEALTWELLTPSPDRRTSPCPYEERCGGCNVMALTPAAQRRAKHDMVVEILRRTARLDASAASATPLIWNDALGEEAAREAGARDLHYRTRIRLHVDEGGALGFLAEQSHLVVPVERCLVATESVNQVLIALVSLSKLRPELLAPFEQVEIRALGETPDLLWFSRRPPSKHRPRPAAVAALETLERHFESECPELTLKQVLADEAPKRWREFVQSVALDDAEGPRLWFAPGTFTQVNWNVNLQIVGNLVASAQRRGCHDFLDLYCGAGNFSLPLLAMGLRGVGVESNPTSIAAATGAATRQGLGGRFVAEDVASAVDRLLGDGAKFDLVLLDPPRAGFRDVVGKLAKFAPKHLFVCACDPVTFARDLRSLLDEGFELEQLEAYDMFPQTHHVECSAWLRYAPTTTPV